ncbi:MAG: NAD-binding protein [Planctomycetaceae bacterium]
MRRLFQIPVLLLMMLSIGAIGLRLLTGQPLLECFFNAFILLTTVGSQQPEPLTNATMIFVMVYLACGLGIFAYSAFQFGRILVNADIQAVLERRRMESRINKLTNHFIVCGCGRMGQELAEYLHKRGQPFVIIDQNDEIFDTDIRVSGWLYLAGDATQDDVLLKAGITRARALTTVLPTDANNLYVVLSARLLSASLQIVARASDDRAAQKMTQAGATRVINPLSSGAIRMARFMLSPSIENFVEVAESEGVDWQIADVHVPENSPLVNQPLKDTKLREAGIMLLGIVRDTGEKFFPPPGHLKINAGDNLFAFGSSENLGHLTKLLEKPTNAT